MAKLHARSQRYETTGDRDVFSVGVGSELKCGAAHQRRIARRFSGSHQEKQLRLGIELLDLLREMVLEPPPDRQGVAKRLFAAQLLLRQSRRQLDEREGAAAGRRHDGTPRFGFHGQVDAGRQQFHRCVVGKPTDREDREAVERALDRGHITDTEQQCNAVRLEAAHHKTQRLERLPVYPLRIVDDAEQSAFRCDVGEQAQAAEADEEPIGRVVCLESERQLQGVPLRYGESVTLAQDGTQEAMQRGVAEICLGLDAGDHEMSEGARPVDRILEQARLAHAGVADQHTSPAESRGRRVHDAIQRRSLLDAIDEFRHGESADVDNPIQFPLRFGRTLDRILPLQRRLRTNAGSCTPVGHPRKGDPLTTCLL